MRHQFTINSKDYDLSLAEVEEMVTLGIVRQDPPTSLTFNPPPAAYLPRPPEDWRPRGVSVSTNLLNEAEEYGSAFARATVVEIRAGDHLMFVSGTASVGSNGETLHPTDFRAQLWRTYRNISGLLHEQQLNWFDVLRTTCYLRDIERDYADFNQVRTMFFNWQGLHPYPASTGIQAILCRPDLLVEIELMALRRQTSA